MDPPNCWHTRMTPGEFFAGGGGNYWFLGWLPSPWTTSDHWVRTPSRRGRVSGHFALTKINTAICIVRGRSLIAHEAKITIAFVGGGGPAVHVRVRRPSCSKVWLCIQGAASDLAWKVNIAEVNAYNPCGPRLWDKRLLQIIWTCTSVRSGKISSSLCGKSSYGVTGAYRLFIAKVKR